LARWRSWWRSFSRICRLIFQKAITGETKWQNKL
jgi:hypothetical protein